MLTLLNDVRYAHLNRTDGVRQSHFAESCENRMVPGVGPADILAALKRLNVPHERIAAAIGRERSAATKLLLGRRSLKANEVEPLLALVREYEDDAGEIETARHARPPSEIYDDGSLIEYLPVEVLPTYAGMGGGGTGDDDKRMYLLPRQLVEDQLNAKPSDLLVINVRGNSMEPQFKQEDQLLIDKRDRDPVQPGPFAIWDGDGFVVKNIERVPGQRGRVRIFSSNTQYREYEADLENITIMGRPVWFARRL